MSKQKIKTEKKPRNEVKSERENLKESAIDVEEKKEAVEQKDISDLKVPWKKGKRTKENELEEKLKVINEKYLRLLAEYDNFRKRTTREIENILKTANENLINELLPILDNLDRATAHKNDKETLEEYLKGIELIENQLRDILKRAGLEPMEVIGKPFDPNFHDALMKIESDEYESGIVTSENQKGYILSEKVIRHAKVIVSK